MAFSVKDWKDYPDTSTPITAASLEDMETRLSTYTTGRTPISVSEYGTVGNGSTDDTTALQAALDAGAGGAVYLPPGTYVTTGVTIASGTRLFGAGPSSVLKAKSGMTGPVLSSTSTSAVSISDLKIDGNKANAGTLSQQDGLKFQSATDVMASRVTVDSAKVHGIRVYGCTGARIEGCFVSNSTATLYGSISVEGSNEVAVVGNRVLDSGYIGILVGAIYGGADSHGVSVTGNVVKGSTFIGIATSGSTSVSITGNTVLDSTDNAIDTGTSTKTAIVGNVIDTCLDGIDLDLSELTPATKAQITISGNQITTCARTGISIDGPTNGASEITVSGNSVVDVEQHGIRLDSLSYCTVTGNTVTNVSLASAGYAGIRVSPLRDGCSHISVVGNTVREDNGANDMYAIDCGGSPNDYNIFTANILDCPAANWANKAGNHSVVDGNYPAYVDSATGTPTVASAATVTLPAAAGLVYITGTTSITSVTASWQGRVVTLLFAGVLTFTDASGNLALNGNMTTSADDTITLICDGTNWYEIARSAN